MQHVQEHLFQTSNFPYGKDKDRMDRRDVDRANIGKNLKRKLG